MTTPQEPLTQVPQFSAVAHDGTEVDTEKLRGKTWVLYFYPRDNTPGCTVENNEFSQLASKFADNGIALFGASRDSARSHSNFANKHQLTVPLIADTDEHICSLFQVMVSKNMYGKKVRGIERSSFLIAADGSIARSWRKVKAEGHAHEVLQAALEHLGKDSLPAE